MRNDSAKSLSPAALDAIRTNIFAAAHSKIPDWETFKWHRTKGEPDAHVPHSSQAFCISVWGTFASTDGKPVREIITQLLGDAAFTEAVQRYPSGLPAQLESDSRDLLGEHGGMQSHLDVALPLDRLSAVVPLESTVAGIRGEPARTA